jgi:drug/metabolite transporter (DMT)-like permease
MNTNQLPGKAGRAISSSFNNSLFRNHSVIAVYGAAFVTIFLFALTPITTRVALRQIDSLGVGLVRVVAAAPLSGLLLLACRLRPPIAHPTERKLLAISAAGGFIGFSLLFSFGAERTSALHAGFGLALTPLFTGLIGMAVDRHRPHLGWLLGAGVAIAGEAGLLMVRFGDLSQGTSIIGDLLVLAAACSNAIGFVAGSRLAARTDAWTATFWGVLVAGLVLAPALWFNEDFLMWRRLDLTTWIAVAHLALGATIVGYMAWFYALARGGLARVSVLQFLQPIFTAAFAGVLLGERLTMVELAMGATILTGVIVARQSRI